MGSQTENLLTVIDVGSAKTCVIVAEVNDYALRYRGHGISDSRGMRKGVIADLDKAVDSIKKAVEEAENVAQVPVEHAVVGVAGSLACMRFIGDLLFGVSATDLATYVTIPLVLFVVALGATWIPARRATKVDPIVALRYE